MWKETTAAHDQPVSAEASSGNSAPGAIESAPIAAPATASCATKSRRVSILWSLCERQLIFVHPSSVHLRRCAERQNHPRDIARFEALRVGDDQLRAHL